MLEILQKAAAHNGLVTAFAVVGLIVLVSGEISRRLTFGRVHGSAIAIVIGLALAYWGGTQTGGHKGLADMSLFGGIGLMGGAMLRDFAIVATAFEVQVHKLGLTQTTCVASEELRQWCERNKDHCYIPEWLLDAWDILVESDFSGAV